MRKEHDCKKCHGPIMYGMPYIGTVIASGGRVFVEREHDYCPDDFDREIQERFFSKEPLAQAA